LKLKRYLHGALYLILLDQSCGLALANEHRAVSKTSKPAHTCILNGSLYGYASSKDLDLSESKCLARLNKATCFSGRSTGIAGGKTIDFAAYEGLFKIGPSVRPKVENLWKTASPAGRLYAAILLEHVDSKAGRKALTEMLSDSSMVEVRLAGCVGAGAQVKEVARRLLLEPRIRICDFETVQPDSYFMTPPDWHSKIDF